VIGQIEDGDIRSVSIVFIIAPERVLLLDLGTESTVGQDLDRLLLHAIVVVDGVAALDAARCEMNSEWIQRYGAFSLPAVTYRAW